MYKGLLFDMDGVLLDTEELSYGIWNEFLRKKAGRCLSRQDYGQISGMAPEAFDRFLETRYGNYAKELRRYWGEQMERLADLGKIPVKPGYEELLRFLRVYPGKKAIVSSNGGSWMAQYIDCFHFNSIFDEVIRGDMAQKRKPDPELYLLALERLGLTNTECLAVEDSASGIAAANAAGVDVLWLKDISVVPPELRKKCVYEADSLEDAVQYFHRVCKT